MNRKKRIKIIPEDKIIDLYKKGKYVREIARILNIYPQVIRNCLIRNNISIVYRTNPGLLGEKNGRWKGGVRMIKGYPHIYSPNHHLARKDGWVPEHRWIMEEYINRKLKPGEVVHHRFDIINDPLNLKIYKTNGFHIKEHMKHQIRDEKGQFKERKKKKTFK
jgi:hypothetical protein